MYEKIAASLILWLAERKFTLLRSNFISQRTSDLHGFIELLGSLYIHAVSCSGANRFSPAGGHILPRTLLIDSSYGSYSDCENSCGFIMRVRLRRGQLLFEFGLGWEGGW